MLIRAATGKHIFLILPMCSLVEDHQGYWLYPVCMFHRETADAFLQSFTKQIQ